MMRQFIKITVIVLCLLTSVTAYTQDRIQQIELQLKSMTTEIPGLEENVEMSVSGVSIQEFMRGIAEAHKLNISVDPDIEQNIVNNFANATVSDVIVFICKEYDLGINFIGNIISIVKHEAPKPKAIEVPVKELKINYNSNLNQLSLDLNNDSLAKVAKAITQKSKKNIILSSGVSPKLVSVYIENMTFNNALEKLGLANDLIITQAEDSSYLIEKNTAVKSNKPTKKTNNSNPRKSRNSDNKKEDATAEELAFEIREDGLISVSGTDILIEEVIKNVADKMELDYYFISEIKDKTTVNVQGTTFKSLLDNMFRGTELTYEVSNGIHIIGERKTEGLRTTKVIQLQYRSVENLNENIPADIKQDVDVKEFLDLNSLILCGSQPRIAEIERFIKEIDKIVPVVLIEVMIVDYSNSRSNTLGIEAGLADQPTTTTSTILPDPSINMGSNTINRLIESFNGYGILNLGKVTSNFYLNIRALETQGVLRVKSTPKLATLNGHEANMSIGNTEYYVEETTNTIASQSPQTLNTRTYKSVNADLSITIKPFVAGDDQITLEIAVSQSDFTAKIEPGAPPGSVSRDFTSLIRVKNQEMVLLGGLEEKSVNESGRGIPFLSRIPVIKWFFSSRTKEKSKAKLNIFIKPTVIY